MSADATPKDDRPVCLLGMPTYGGGSLVAYSALFQAGRRTANRIASTKSSLLARAFNELWVTALNARHKGEPCDYFAMLHPDVEPEFGWLDKLVAILEAKQLDVLSAVVPIKSNHGLTSTAYTDGSNPWRPQGRLTLKEVHNLPETFTQADLPAGLKLLLNTGCWVAKLGDWAMRYDPTTYETDVHFEINDRIIFDPKADCYVIQCEPEDWHFSRQVNGLGLKIGATRAVKLDHTGDARYGNVEPWGDPFDKAYRETSILEIQGASHA